MSNISFRLCAAVHDDIDALYSMESVCFSDSWSRDYFENLLKNPCVHFILVTENDVPVGYAGVTTIIDECEILNVAVMPDHRRKGIGRLLMEHVIEDGRRNGVSFFFLEHRASNTAAAALYESFGFTEYDRRRNYYTMPTEDAILRKLTL